LANNDDDDNDDDDDDDDDDEHQLYRQQYCRHHLHRHPDYRNHHYHQQQPQQQRHSLIAVTSPTSAVFVKAPKSPAATWKAIRTTAARCHHIDIRFRIPNSSSSDRYAWVPVKHCARYIRIYYRSINEKTER